MRREQLFAAFFFAAFLYLLYQFVILLSYFVGPLSWAALLALMFYPVHRRLVGVLRQREGLAAFLLTTAIILVVIAPTISLTAVLTTQSVELYQEVKVFVEGGRLNELMQRVADSPAGGLWQRLLPQLAVWHVDLAGVALKTSNAVSGFLVAQAPAAAANVVRFVVNFFLTTFALFFFFRDGTRMVRSVRDLIPMEPSHKDAILTRLYDTLSAVVQGTLLTAAAQGFLAGLGFSILSVPFAILLGGATAFLSLVPFGGPLVWIGVAMYLAAIEAYTRAVIMVVWGVLIIGTADNFIRPLIIGGRTHIPTIILFFGILGGLQAYGFLGLFLGPALIAILVAFIRIYREEYTLNAPRPPARP